MHLPPGTLPLLVDYFSVILIDILLAGDNALVIAMTVRVLSKQQRRIEVALNAALVANASPGFVQIKAPIDAHNIATRLGHRL